MMKSVISVVALFLVVVSCAPAKTDDSEAEVVYAATSEPRPVTYIPNPNQYRPVVYPFQQPQYTPVYRDPQVYQKPYTPLKFEVQARREPQFAIVRSSLDNNFDGNFQYDFETENGIVANAVGSVRQLGPQEIGQAVVGSYSYTSPEGRVITTTYTADENGFLAQGDHLPVAPAVPELPPLIAKSIAYILSQPPLPENQQ